MSFQKRGSLYLGPALGPLITWVFFGGIWVMNWIISKTLGVAPVKFVIMLFKAPLDSLKYATMTTACLD